MATKTYRGSCHCGQVKFEADIDLAAGTSKCNCTNCWKKRWWSATVKPEAFRPLAGKEQMSRFKPGDETPRGGFCKHCGVHAYGWVDKAEWNDGASVSISVAALDDLDPADLMAAPVRFCDGRADNWWNPPAETRHL